MSALFARRRTDRLSRIWHALRGVLRTSFLPMLGCTRAQNNTGCTPYNIQGTNRAVRRAQKALCAPLRQEASFASPLPCESV